MQGCKFQSSYLIDSLSITSLEYRTTFSAIQISADFEIKFLSLQESYDNNFAIPCLPTLWSLIAELWRLKRACWAPWVSKSTHPRKFGNHVTVHRPPAAHPCLISHFLASLGAQEDWYCTHIAHQYCDQLIAVKTGYPLTSITWPYRWLRCQPKKKE